MYTVSSHLRLSTQCFIASNTKLEFAFELVVRVMDSISRQLQEQTGNDLLDVRFEREFDCKQESGHGLQLTIALSEHEHCINMVPWYTQACAMHYVLCRRRLERRYLTDTCRQL